MNWQSLARAPQYSWFWRTLLIILITLSFFLAKFITGYLIGNSPTVSSIAERISMGTLKSEASASFGEAIRALKAKIEGPKDASKIALISKERTLIVDGPPEEITIQIQDKNGRPTAVPSDNQVNLKATSSGGEFSASIEPWVGIKTINIATGNHSASFYYRDKNAGKSIISAQLASVGWTDTRAVYISRSGFIWGLILTAAMSLVAAGLSVVAFTILSHKAFPTLHIQRTFVLRCIMLLLGLSYLYIRMGTGAKEFLFSFMSIPVLPVLAVFNSFNNFQYSSAELIGIALYVCFIPVTVAAITSRIAGRLGRSRRKYFILGLLYVHICPPILALMDLSLFEKLSNPKLVKGIVEADYKITAPLMRVFDVRTYGYWRYLQIQCRSIWEKTKESVNGKLPQDDNNQISQQTDNDAQELPMELPHSALGAARMGLDLINSKLTSISGQLVCLEHFTRFESRPVETPVGIAKCVVCRTCGAADKVEYVKEIVAVLDNKRRSKYLINGDVIYVSYNHHREIFDFDRVIIVDASDFDVEYLCVDIENDMDERRKGRYKKMKCSVSSDSRLRDNTAKIIKRTFGVVENAVEAAYIRDTENDGELSPKSEDGRE